MITLTGGAMDGASVQERAVDGNFLVSYIKRRKWNACGERFEIWDWARSAKDAHGQTTYRLDDGKLVHDSTEITVP